MSENEISKKENERLEKLKGQADSGDSLAQYDYGKYLKNRGSECERYFQMSADQGNIKAQYEMYKVSKTPSRREHYLRMAAEGGLVDAQLQYGCSLYNGDDGVSVDIKKSAYYFKLAADQNDPNGLCFYGECLFNGDGVDKNFEEACSYYMRAAQLGNSTAILHYGYCLAKGIGVPQDDEEAVRMFHIAADKGEEYGINNYADCRYKGKGGPRDVAEAARYYRLSSRKGLSYGMNSYARMLLRGEGVEQDIPEAIRLLTQLKDKKNRNGLFNYACCQLLGIGVQQDEEAAIRQLSESCFFKNFFWDQTHSLLFTSSVYRENKSHLERINTGLENGNPEAQCNMGFLKLRGESCDQNYDEAYNLFTQSSELGHVGGRLGSGICLYNGYGIEKDMSHAKTYIISAVEEIMRPVSH